MSNQKVIMLLDMDAFFASCLQAKYPEYKNKPIVISEGKKRSIICAASYEARKFGARSAMPFAQAQTLAKGKLIPVHADMILFKEISNSIWSLLRNQITTKIEVSSIDECYIDATDVWQNYGSPKNLAIEIQRLIKQSFNLTCTIGISNNRFLAKMICREVKPNGIGTLNPKNYRNFLWPLKVEEMYGVGIATTKKLHGMDIFTIEQLAKTDEQFLISKFGKYGSVLWNKAHGIESTKIDFYEEKPKNISSEITVNFPIHSEEEILTVIDALINKNLRRLARKKLVAKGFSVSYHYQWQRKDKEEFDKRKHLSKHSLQTTLDNYTNNFEEISALLHGLIEKQQLNYETGITLIGVAFKDLIFIENVPQQKSFQLK